MDLFIRTEASFHDVLKKLLAVCESHSRYSGSSLDPMVKVGCEMREISSCLRRILRKHAAVYHNLSLTENTMNFYSDFFEDVRVLDMYHSLLFGCMRLLLDADISFFRMNSQKSFTILLFKVYYKLRDVYYATNETRLDSLLNAFIYQFKNCYNSVSCNTLKYGSVRDIMSQNFSLINPPFIGLKEVTKRTYFRLDIEKLKINNKLIEILELNNGGIALFEVLGSEMPYTSQNVETLFQSLASGNHDLMNVGRSLLFQTLRAGDLEIIKLDDNGAKLKTLTGNGVVLKITCKDPSQWQAHWKDIIRNLSDRLSMNKYNGCKSDFSQNFHAGHNKVGYNQPEQNAGMATGSTEPSVSSSNTVRSSGTLHRSTHLPGGLSSLVEASQEFSAGESNSILNGKVISDNDSDLETSLKDIESLSCEKLIELDRSIQIPLSPKILDTPTLKNVRTASQIFSLENVSPELLESASSEISDDESIISEGEKDNGEETVFDPNVDYYKPVLYRRKSSSLLSVFTSKNKKDLTIDIPKNRSGSLFSIAGDQQLLTPISAGSHNSDVGEAYVSVPSDVDASSSAVFFENDLVKVSLWNGKSWVQLSKEAMCLSLILSGGNETLLIISKNFKREKCKFVVKLESSWKCNRSTAQDVQLRIYSSDFKASVFEMRHDVTLSIRCSQADQLMSVLQYQLQRIQAPSLPASATARTLSTISSSSCFSRNVTRSSTENSELANMKNGSGGVNSSLLLSSIKVRQHVKTKSDIWKPSRVGFADIFSQEYKGIVVAIKFVICSDAEGTLNPREYNSRLHDIKRLGRTGLSLADRTGAYLLEFKDRNAADQVYKLAMPPS
ncbi:hypothetical protein SEUBUCD650_0J02230 [Saccharomyces eubayanus]|uniref:Uncharacterized protein n=1 Tax=Saccharomyces eubayanus TaxID=1080349 RepID=A0ABN8VCJ3_SACEU|nr:hypothetical protein SEUBUCD650_0J02230 [Saccharomyces eubayanus]